MQKKLWVVFLSSIFLAGLGLRLYQLGAESLWVDEIRHADAASRATWQDMFNYDLSV